MKMNLIIPGVALAVGLGVGLGIGRAGREGGDEVGGTEIPQRTRVSERGANGVGGGDGADKRRKSLDEIYRQPGQTSRVQALLDFYSNLGPEEFASEAEKLDALPFNERILAGVLLFGKWAEVDPTAAMAFTDTMGFSGMFVRPTVLQGWASTDPVNAAKYFENNPAQFAMMNMMGGRGGRGMGAQGAGAIIAGEWAKQDPEAALDWAAGLKSNSGEAVSSVVLEIAKTDPAKAAELAKGIQGEGAGVARETVAKQWGAKNFTEAAAWANGLPEGQRGGVLASAIEGFSVASPERAAEELEKITDPGEKRKSVPIVAKSYARQDVKGSMAWLQEQDEGAVRDSMREVMPIWAAADAPAALEFIKGTTSQRVKDRAAETYVWSNKNTSMPELAGVAAMISDEGDRSRSTGIVAARWLEEDKGAATEFINTNASIPQQMKDSLLSGEGVWGGRGRGREGN